MSCPNVCTESSGIVAGISGVHTGAGATALTRTLCFRPISESALVNVVIAPLVLA